MLFSDSIAQPAPGRCRFERVWDFPTSILQSKVCVCERSAAMKAPVGLLSDGAVLRSKMEGLCPDKFRHDAQNADNARKNTAFPPVCKKCAKVCRVPENGKSHEESFDSSWDFGALEGTRIPGPLIKRIQGASFVKFQKFEESLFLSYHRKTRLCTHRIVCIQCNALQPLSSYSGVQKVCKNVQTGKTKPNGQINHRFYGRV